MRATFWPLSTLIISACFQADANDFIISCEDDGLCPDGFLCANDLICENEELLLPTVDPIVAQTPFPNALITGKTLGGAEVRVFVDGDEVVDFVADPDPNPLLGVGDFSIFVPLNNGNNQIRVEAELQGVIQSTEVDILNNPLEVDLDANTNLFTNVAAARGLNFIVPSLTNNADNDNQGATFQDIDNDGDVDLLIGSDPQGVIRLNDGTGDFSAGPPLVSHIAAAFADLDQDGDLDVAVSATPNPAANNDDFAAILFNDLDDGEADFGGAQFATDAINSEGVTLFEGAQEGFLDVFFQDGGENRIQRNNNDGNNFAIQAREAAISSKDSGNNNGNGSFATACDIDFDGNVDLLVNDAPNFQLFESAGNGNFNPVAGNFLIADGNNRGRGLLLADFNKDGAFEIAAAFGGNGIGIIPVNFNAGDILPGPVEILQVPADGISAADLDLDGDLDLIASDDNGPDHFLVNQGGIQGGILGEFVELVDALDNNNGNGEGVAIADIDLDGDLDIFVVDQAANSRLYENQLDDIHSRRLRVVRVSEDGFDVDIVGAIVTLFENTADEPRLFGVQQVDGGSGHGSQEPLNLFFGGASPRRAYLAEIQIPGCDDPIELDLQPDVTIFRFEECP